MAALRDYQHDRDRVFPAPGTPALLVSTRGTRLDANITRTFAGLVRAAGITTPAGQRPPRLADFRHSFCTATLLDWYRDGADVHARMPRLTHLPRSRRPEVDVLVSDRHTAAARPGRRPTRAHFGAGDDDRRVAHNDLAPLLQGFFTDKLMRQRQASPHTIAAYRDTFKLLLQLRQPAHRRRPAQLGLADLDADTRSARSCSTWRPSAATARHPQRPPGRDPLLLRLRRRARTPSTPR